jgi:hypothetical protein
MDDVNNDRIHSSEIMSELQNMIQKTIDIENEIIQAMSPQVIIYEFYKPLTCQEPPKKKRRLM